MLCEPKKLCPQRLGVIFDKNSEKCFDFFQGIFISPVDAKKPNSTNLFNVKFIC